MLEKNFSISREDKKNLCFGIRWGLRIFSLATGVYQGFCNANGISAGEKELASALNYSQLIAWAGATGLINSEISILEKMIKDAGGIALGVPGQITAGAIVGGIKGEMYYLIGQGIGYVAGKTIK